MPFLGIGKILIAVLLTTGGLYSAGNMINNNDTTYKIEGNITEDVSLLERKNSDAYIIVDGQVLTNTKKKVNEIVLNLGDTNGGKISFSEPVGVSVTLGGIEGKLNYIQSDELNSGDTNHTEIYDGSDVKITLPEVNLDSVDLTLKDFIFKGKNIKTIDLTGSDNLVKIITTDPIFYELTDVEIKNIKVANTDSFNSDNYIYNNQFFNLY